MYLLIIMNLLWAASYSFMKWGMEYLAPIHLLFVRMLVSFIVLFFVSFGKWKGMPVKVVFRCALLGLVIAIAHGFGIVGMDKSHAIDGAVLYALEPIVAIVYARILLKERMDSWRILALVLALTGFAILSNVFSDNLLSNLTFVGNFLMLIGVFADGAFSSVAKPAVEHYPARVIMMIALLFTTLFLLPFAIATPVRSTVISWQPVVSIFYLSVICTSVGWTIWVYFLKRFPVNIIALTVFLQPVFGPFISHFTLGEQISARVWFGGSVILIAIAIAVFKRKSSETELIAEAVIR